MDISVGVIAHNEEKNIRRILESITNQNTEHNIKQVIVVSSSSDRTNDIASEFPVMLIAEEQRSGKARAINRFLRAATSDILVLVSADVLPRKNTIQNICEPLKDPNTGIVASRPIPKDKGSISQIVDLQWEIHHSISKRKTKYGELIAFRKVLNRIPDTAADEEYIAMLVKSQGYKGAYSENALVYNKGPTTLKDYFVQRRRIHCGHLALKKEKGYRAASLSYPSIVSAIISSKKPARIKAAGVLLEAYARMLGRIDYHLGKNHCVWEMVQR